MKIKRIIIYLVLTGVGVLSALEDSRIGNAPLLDGALVRARVMRLQKNDSGLDVVLKVEEVFYGDKNALEKILDVHTVVLGGYGVLVLDTTPQIGESSLWKVSVATNVQAAIYEMQEYGEVVRLPLFAHEHAEYDVAIEWAQKVRAISEIEPVMRFDALQDGLITSSNKIIQAWAIRFVGEYGNQREIDILKEGLLNNRTSLYGQLAVDEVLCSRLGRQWSHSDLRASKLQEWMSSSLDQATEFRLVTRLDVSSQRGEITDKQLIAIRKIAITNTSISSGSLSRIERMNSRNY